MPINEADLQWLRNDNTSPGPNAGRSIDPTKPGPDDDDPCHGPEDTTCPSCGLGFVQSGAEPVAWQWRYIGDAKWNTPSGGERQDRFVILEGGASRELEHRPLFAGPVAPPRPNASVGLIEAAEIAEEHAGRTAGSAQYALEDLAATLRARAADRGGK